MKRQESLEDYLETILVLNKSGAVRSIDVANKMNFSKPSVSVAMKNLKSKELITIDDNGFITLTDAGRNIAESIYERHTILTKALVGLGVSEEVAREDACRIEHDISEETFEKIKEHVNIKGVYTC
ncbi:MAG: metal-dependent transcriptional regulator [Clostridium sp.]|uniref:metal-dependent transcriptional regulator n=1 Tax=Clostridium sp. TaxID=1506 RepID=UPI002A8838AF|nr:metal-dependent transcriptional regulator [Clostridium sp.]MDY5097018.1 metal-dependent transcriptional regulator [Clostridium sp.]